MSGNPSEISYQRQLFAKRRLLRVKTLFSKADELSQYDAAVYAVVRYGGKYHYYSSLDHPRWPPAHEEIVRHRLGS
jgi:hypothetical protein